MSPMPAAAPRGVASAPHVSSGQFASGARVALRPGSTTVGRTVVIIRTPRRPATPILRNGIPLTPIIDDGFIGVPGLGFDFPHLAATRGARAVGVRRHHRAFGSFIPFFDSGFFLPISPTIVEEVPVPVVESPDADSSDVETVHAIRRPRAEPAPSAAEAAAIPAVPIREPEEFVFVRRDGTVFFAVAYAWENGTLRYVTREGQRRLIARDALDLGATQQFNEQRGVDFRSPV